MTTNIGTPPPTTADSSFRVMCLSLTVLTEENGTTESVVEEV